MAGTSFPDLKNLQSGISAALRAWHTPGGTPEDLLESLLLVQERRADVGDKDSPALLRLATNQVLLEGIEELASQDETAARVLRLRFSEGNSLLMVANKLNVSEHTVSRLQRAAIDRLAEVIHGRELALRETRTQTLAPHLVNLTGNSLPPFVQESLTLAFAGYQRVIIKGGMGGGFSGSRIYLVRPISDSGAEIPVVVKIGSDKLIQQEWEAYQAFISHRLPGVAEISGEPVYLSRYGCLRYTLVGSGTFEVETLFNYCRSAPAEDITYLLENRLFKVMDAIWRQSTLLPEYPLLYAYDDLLPVNLIVQETELQDANSIHWLNPDIVHGYKLNVGDAVTLSGFRVVEIAQNETLILNSPYETRPYHIRLQISTSIDSYEFGQVIHQPISGIVKNTRNNILIESVRAAIGNTFDLMADSLALPSGDVLPNPLISLPKVLGHSFDMRVSPIHGKLDLESVLVEPENRNIYLIDFIHAHTNHVLRDLIRLEMDVITRLLPEALKAVQLTPQSIDLFLKRVHCAVLYPDWVSPPHNLEKAFVILLAIRKSAQRYLFQTEDWREYYLGLFAHLLSAFKYHSLDLLPTAPYPKEVAFWGAASVMKLLETETFCADVMDSNSQKTSSTLSSKRAIHQEYLMKLAKLLETRFDREELRTLCFNLGVDYDDLPGTSRVDKAGELIRHLQRRDRLSELINAGKQLRPHLSWDDAPDVDDEAFIVVDEAHTTTHFYGPVTGPVHTGSGDISFTMTTRFALSDDFSRYETGVQRLLDQLDNNSSVYDDVLTMQKRLLENITRVQRFGDTSLRRSERAEIIDRLNELSLQALGVSFNELCA